MDPDYPTTLGPHIVEYKLRCEHNWQFVKIKEKSDDRYDNTLGDYAFFVCQCGKSKWVHLTTEEQ